MKRELEELIGILCYKGWGFRMRKRTESDACGMIVYKLRIGYKFVAFDNLDSAKKFIENNVKGE